MLKADSETPAPGLEQGEDPLAGTSYRAIRALGKGGMGEVFLAEHVRLHRRVVVKLLHESLVSFPKHVDRIRVEAETLGRLQHPNIVEVRDFGTTPVGRPFIVMERLLGISLHQEILQRGALTISEAVGCVRQVLAALSAAHELGIVHRDIKLDNVFIHQPAVGPRVVKVLDFGIAKILDGVSTRAPKPLIPTDEGIIVGTPRYVSPEAALGKAVDHRADIYSAGLVLYTLLAGRGPWDDEKREGQLIVAQATRKPEPPSKYAKQPIPAELEQQILRALEKAPEQRFQTAHEFAAALDRFDGDTEASSDANSLAVSDSSRFGRPDSKLPPPLDVHATLIDEMPPFAAGDTDADRTALGFADTSEQRAHPTGTEVLALSNADEPKATRTAALPRDPTELVALEAALKRRVELPKPIIIASLALGATALMLLGWYVVRLLNGN